MTQTTTIDLIRHGEPVGGRRYRGQINDPLSKKGWQQMWTAIGNQHPWQQIVSSSLSRCADFSNEVSKLYDIPARFDKRFMEIGFGDWEGKSASQIKAEDEAQFNAFFENPVKNTPPNAESLFEFEQRVLQAWDEMLQEDLGKHILLVGHAGMIRMIIRHVLGMPLEAMYRIKVPNAGITRLAVGGSRGQSELIFHAGSL